MKVALSASGKSLNDLVDPRFGRCLFFVVVDTNGMKATAYSNESLYLQGSAGIQAAEFLAEKKVSAVITGHCGPNASLSLHRAGIKLYEGQGGIPINQALEKYVNGHLTAAGDSPFSFNIRCGGGKGLTFGRNRPHRSTCLKQPLGSGKAINQKPRGRKSRQEVKP